VIASPEYNYSISSALKNLIDWVSRVQPGVFDKKPVAIFSCTAGPSGGARSQYDLRKMLVFFNAYAMQKPEVMIASNYLKFDQESKLHDEATKKLINDQMVAFVDWVTFVKKGLAK
jgi:chromate reductase, NAD(P)H dehydrogenase (quinone)